MPAGHDRLIGVSYCNFLKAKGLVKAQGAVSPGSAYFAEKASPDACPKKCALDTGKAIAIVPPVPSALRICVYKGVADRAPIVGLPCQFRS